MANWLAASRHTRALPALLSVALSLPALAAAQEPAPAERLDAVAQAEQYAAQAFEAYQQARYADALALYEQAYASAPSADALYNIARIHDVGLRDVPRAIAAYERCLLERGATPERLARAGERILQLQRSVETQALPSQRRPVVASVAVPPPPAATAGEALPQGWSRLRGAAVISGAAGIVSLGVGLGFGMASISAANQARAACTGNLCRSQRGVEAARAASTRATSATAGVTVGAVLLATSATLWILGAEPPAGEVLAAWESEPVESEAAGAVRLAPLASARELGLAFEGTW